MSDNPNPPSATTVQLGNGLTLQYQTTGDGVVLLVSGPGLVGTTGAVLFPQTPPTSGIPTTAIFVGPVQQAETALLPYVPLP